MIKLVMILREKFNKDDIYVSYEKHTYSKVASNIHLIICHVVGLFEWSPLLFMSMSSMNITWRQRQNFLVACLCFVQLHP
jgi:hypothetical protein